MDYEDRRSQVLRILPKNLGKDAFKKMSDLKDVDGLNSWIRVQVEFKREWDQGDTDRGAKAKGLHALEPDGEVDGPAAEDMEALYALGPYLPLCDVLAI